MEVQSETATGVIVMAKKGEFTKANLKKVVGLMDKIGVKVAYDTEMKDAGRWQGDGTILINPENADTYTILHEIGHFICGWGCCREHCEFEAHGAAKALARAEGIKIDLKDAEKRMDTYAGWSSHQACGRINP
jgi:hypothetical protein